MTTSRLIATTAPSGNVGRHVVGGLVRAGVRPRVLAHSSTSVDPVYTDHVATHVTDLSVVDEVRAALADVDALFVTVPSVMSEDPLGDYGRYGAAIASAVTDAGVGHVVLQSSAGAELRGGAGEIDGLAVVEQLLDETPASVLHLRCGFFFSNLVLQVDQVRAGEVPVLVPTDAAMPWVAPADIAAVATTWLLRSDWTGRHVQAVHGPVDLSWDEALAIVADVTGHEVRAETIDEATMRAAMVESGMPGTMADAINGMSTGLGEGFVPEQPRDATSTTPTTLAAWCVDELRPLLALSA